MAKHTNIHALKVFSLRLPDPLRAAAARAAKRQRLTLSKFIRRSVIDRLERDGIEVARGRP